MDRAVSPLVEEASPPFGDPTPIEERLEAELGQPSADSLADAAGPAGGDAQVDYHFGLSGFPLQKELPLETPKKPLEDKELENLSEEDAIVELAALRLQRACQDMVDEARAEALMSRIVRNREEAFHFDEEGEPDFGGGSGGPGGEPPASPRAFSRRVSARRLALAASALALLVATPLTLGTDPTQWPQRLSAMFEPAPIVAASAVEWRRDNIVRTAKAGAVDPAVDQALAASNDSAWRVNLAERLANRAAQIGNDDPASAAESGLQDWHAKSGVKTVRVVPDGGQQSQSDGVTLAVASALEETSELEVGAVRNAALANSIVRLDDRGLNQAETGQAQSEQVASAQTGAEEQAGADLAALASPRPEDVLAAANARETERQARLAEEEKPEPRDPRQVEVALAATAAVSELKPSQRRELAARLSDGECLATSLDDYFSPVPVLLMRDLIQSLDSEC